MKGQVVQGFWGKRMPLWGRNDQGRKLLPLFVRDRSAKILHLDQPFPDEDYLCYFVDSGHPGVASQLRVECCDAGRLFRISCRGGFPLQHTGRAVQFANAIDIRDEVVPGG